MFVERALYGFSCSLQLKLSGDLHTLTVPELMGQVLVPDTVDVEFFACPGGSWVVAPALEVSGVVASPGPREVGSWAGPFHIYEKPDWLVELVAAHAPSCLTELLAGGV